MAASVQDQTTTGNFSNFTNTCAQNFQIAQSFRALYNNLTGVNVNHGSYISGNAVVKVCRGVISTSTDYTGTSSSDCGTQTFVASTTMAYNSYSGHTNDFAPFANTITLSPGQDYYISFDYPVSVSLGLTWEPTSNFYNRAYSASTSPGCAYIANSGDDLIFGTWHDDLNTLSINFQEPVADGIYKDFVGFIVNYNAPISGHEYSISLDYGTSSSMTAGTYSTIDQEVISGTSLNTTMLKPNKLNDGTYYMKAYIFDWNSSLVASTSITRFFIDNVFGNEIIPELYFEEYDIDSACNDVASSSGSTFDDFRYGIECAFRKSYYWATVPHSSSFAQFYQAQDELGGKFPLSLYSQIDTTLDTIQTSTTTFSIPYTIDGKNWHSITGTSSLYNTTNGASELWGNAMPIVRKILTYLIYFATITYIVGRLVKGSHHSDNSTTIK